MTDLYKEQAGDLCPYCHEGTLKQRTSKYGNFLGCSLYPKCAGLVKQKTPKDELEEEADRWLEGWGN